MSSVKYNYIGMMADDIELVYKFIWKINWKCQAGIDILEDPAIFDELIDSGLLSLEGCLTIGQVLVS